MARRNRAGRHIGSSSCIMAMHGQAVCGLWSSVWAAWSGMESQCGVRGALMQTSVPGSQPPPVYLSYTGVAATRQST